MSTSHRTYSHHELKKILKTNKTQQRNNNYIKDSAKTKSSANYQIDRLVQTIRGQQLQILQLRNQMLKKQIQLKQKLQTTKQMQKEVSKLRKDKQNFQKVKQRFENQRKINLEKIERLQQCNQDIKNRLQSAEPPKDRYQTCLRQLDQLKTDIQNKQCVIKQRDFYKYFYEEIKDLVEANEYSAEEVRTNLRILFSDVNQRINTIK